MKSTSSAAALLIFISGQAVADIIPKGGDEYKCQTTGGFFDFSPANAIASCQAEIVDYCKSQNAPPTIGKINGEPSGPYRYAKAEITFQCINADDAAKKQQEIADARVRQTRTEIDASKKMCAEDFGFVPGTPDFSNCLMELQKQSFATRRTAQAIAAQNDIAEAQAAQQRQAQDTNNAMAAIQQVSKALDRPPVIIQSRPTTTINCRTQGQNTSCSSY